VHAPERPQITPDHVLMAERGGGVEREPRSHPDAVAGPQLSQ
jgi:hypothetical protein